MRGRHAGVGYRLRPGNGLEDPLSTCVARPGTSPEQHGTRPEEAPPRTPGRERRPGTVDLRPSAATNP